MPSGGATLGVGVADGVSVRVRATVRAQDAVGRCDVRGRVTDGVSVRVRATARAQDAVGRRDVRGRGCGWR